MSKVVPVTMDISYTLAVLFTAFKTFNKIVANTKAGSTFNGSNFDRTNMKGRG